MTIDFEDRDGRRVTATFDLSGWYESADAFVEELGRRLDEAAGDSGGGATYEVAYNHDGGYRFKPRGPR